MKAINRRDFLKEGVKISSGTLMGANSPGIFTSRAKEETSIDGFSAVIPLPVQVVIDDVGWWSGRDGSKDQEPYRSGIQRNHVPADYEAIVALGKALDIRPQAAMVLCEWDKANILSALPSATWMGKSWDNSKWVGPWMEEAADIIRRNKRHFEITLHGVGHEYWTGNKFSRAEWADTNGTMRPPGEVEKRLDFFERIMSQHELGAFPSSFVPAAFNHGFGATADHSVSMAEILSRHGVNYINTPFHQMYNAEAVRYPYFGFDADVLTVDRGKDLLDWNVIGIPPTGVINGPTCGMHWANLLHPDPARNVEIVNKWVQLLGPYQDNADTMLAPDSDYFQSQLLYRTLTKITRTKKGIALDFKAIDDRSAAKVKPGFTLKVKSEGALRFRSKGIKIRSIQSKKAKGHFLYALRLTGMKGSDKASVSVFHFNTRR
ncbi:MAG: hypothetical protein MI975_07325 [Cytophagales bacterium]|nr:hypothetical protein [Cytophagales bacterium]